MSLSIHLLPEFGWSIRDQPVFGPGSVFQGHIELHLQQPLAMDRLRLVFQGQESLVPFDVTPGVVRAKSIPLFGVQQTLWDSKDGLQSLDVGTYKYPFTIQMPMVQYPPSTTHETYKTTFNLIAVAESKHQSQYKTLILKELEMLYMPFVETRLMKQHLVSTQQQDDIKLTTKLHSLDYVPGDTILGSLTVSTLPSKKPLDVTLKLYKTTTNLIFQDVPALTQLVASTSIKLVSQGTHHTSSLELDIPDDLVPTFTYSKLASVTYRLTLSVKRKGPLSMWAQEATIDWPLTVGTLGAGVRSSSDLMVYSSLTDPQQHRPRFMKAVEYEDALPLYEPSRLPDYQSLTPILV